MSYNILADESFKVYLREACALLPEESQGFVALERPVSKKRLAELGVVRDDFSRVLSIDNWSLRIVLSEALSRGTDGLMYLHTPHGFSPARWVADFCACFCDEIHRIVCTQKKLTAVSKTAGYSAKGASTALAAWMMQGLGFTEPFAIAGAAVIILIVFEATKGAFCRMTKTEVLKKLGE